MVLVHVNLISPYHQLNQTTFNKEQHMKRNVILLAAAFVAPAALAAGVSVSLPAASYSDPTVTIGEVALTGMTPDNLIAGGQNESGVVNAYYAKAESGFGTGSPDPITLKLASTNSSSLDYTADNGITYKIPYKITLKDCEGDTVLSSRSLSTNITTSSYPMAIDDIPSDANGCKRASLTITLDAVPNGATFPASVGSKGYSDTITAIVSSQTLSPMAKSLLVAL
jgi:hypothetical protein